MEDSRKSMFALFFVSLCQCLSFFYFPCVTTMLPAASSLCSSSPSFFAYIWIAIRWSPLFHDNFCIRVGYEILLANAREENRCLTADRSVHSPFVPRRHIVRFFFSFSFLLSFSLLFSSFFSPLPLLFLSRSHARLRSGLFSVFTAPRGCSPALAYTALFVAADWQSACGAEFESSTTFAGRDAVPENPIAQGE